MDMVKEGKIYLSLNCLQKFFIEKSKIVEAHQDTDCVGQVMTGSWVTNFKQMPELGHARCRYILAGIKHYTCCDG